jgi:diguanylate cyclase (GGDEF)-like protein
VSPPGRTTVRASALRVVAVLGVALVVAAVPSVAQSRFGAQGWPFLFLGAVSVAGAISMAVAGSRLRGRARWAWWLLALASTCAAYLHAMIPWDVRPPGELAVRVVAVVLAALALATFPGTGRSTRGWLLLALDGWLVGGSLFIVIWVFAVPGAQLAETPDGLLAGSSWVLLDLALASVVIALTRRVRPGERAGGVLLSVTAILMCNGDLYRTMFSSDGWGDTGKAAFLGCWTMAAVIAGITPWLSPSPFAHVATLEDRRPVRSPYIAASAAIGVAVIAWTLGRPADPLLAAVVITLLASVVVSQAVLGAENARLMDQVSSQADLFRDRAARDLLTGLPNRGEFTGRVERALIGPASGAVAVLFVDLDGFKDVNDSFGHAVGDDLLVEAAGRLSREVRERDVVARFGGDEFVAMLTGCTDEMALEVAERLRQELSRPYQVAGREVVVSASIGLSRPGSAEDAESALRNADLALYRAKSSGRDRVAVYEPQMHEHVLRRLDGAARLRRALAEDRLRVAYQPIVDLRTGAIHGMEALLRFDSQDLPGWSVADAVEAAEESGLIVPVGQWVLDAAVRQSAEWLGSGHEMRVAVNVSARQLEAGGLVEGVEAALARHGLPASLLSLEITEHQLVRDLDQSTRELGLLRQLGVRIALDDFGTGYSSLSYLPRLPLDGLKIDRRLVTRVGGARDTVPAVLRLGRDLGLTVVAEGVEHLDQLHHLRAAGCVLGQGYLFSAPLPPEDAMIMVRAGRMTLPDGSVPMGKTFVSDDETGRVTA